MSKTTMKTCKEEVSEISPCDACVLFIAHIV